VLELREVSVRFGSTVAVDRVSLRLEDGHVLAVLGPSGCGKSTLLRVVAGLEPPSAGSVLFDGADLAGVPAHRRGFALMFQDGQLFPHLTVAGNVGYALRLRRTGRPQREARVAELLELVGLAQYADRRPDTLSGGERQRVALARALAVRPRLLLLDEPLSALDRGLRERLAGDLREVLRAERTTAVLVTHDHEEAFAVADRMAVMRAGRIVQSGTLEEVWRHPADPETARFLGYATVLSGPAAAYVWSRVGGPAAGGPAPVLALRRSALRVRPVDDGSCEDGSGAATGVVTAARLTPDRWRVVVELPEAGRLDAVADPTVAIRAGQCVAVDFDPAMMARLE
jgi:thiamine transport system ATP-binding protein